MSHNPKMYLSSFKKRVFRLEDVVSAGIPKTTFLRLVESGEVERIRRGFYILKKTSIKPEVLDFAVACSKFGPSSIIGGVTALFHYHLIEQVPRAIWVLVPYNRKTNDTFYRCLRTKLPCNVGVEDRGTYRITGIERTIVEAFRYSSKIGIRTAVQAARNAIANRLTTETKIYQMGIKLGLENFVLKHWESVIA